MGLDYDPDCMKEILTSFSSPVVIDADGLNILSRNQELLNVLPANSILDSTFKGI
jgi:ADP-dependent NAD(P)H-hydrate dehydratase / NAD(P)H-hydrate epimerase